MLPDRCDVKSNGGRCKGADLGHWDILTVYRTPPARRSHSVTDTTCKGTHFFLETKVRGHRLKGGGVWRSYAATLKAMAAAPLTTLTPSRTPA